MKQQENISIVKKMFASLGKNDMQGLLDYLADSVDWQAPVTNTVSEPISWSKPRKTRSEVAAFIKEANEKIRIKEMRPNSFIAENDVVVCDATLSGTVISTGREFSTNCLIMVTLKDGKCIRYRNYYDTADVSRAFLMELRKAA